MILNFCNILNKQIKILNSLKKKRTKMSLNENTESLLICKMCNLIFERPIKLPCRKTICNSHLLDSNGNYLTEFDCQFCQNKHEVSIRGFHPNFHIQKQIEQRPGIDLKKDIEESLVNLDNIYKRTEKNENTITEHFSKMRIEINQQREILINQINNLVEEMLERTQTLESEFKAELDYLKTSRKQCLNDFQDEVNFQFRHLKPDLPKLNQQFSNLNTETSNINKQLRNLFQIELDSYVFSPNLTHLASDLIGEIKQKETNLITCHTNGSILKRNLENESRWEFFDGKHDGAVICILISTDNQKLISGGSDGFIKIWDLKTGALLNSVSNTKTGSIWSVRCLVNSPRSNEIFFGSNHQYIRSLDLNTCEVKFFAQNGHASLICCLQFLTNDILLSSSKDLTIKVWSLNDEKCLQTIMFGKCEYNRLRKINDSIFAHSFDKRIKIFSSNKYGYFSCIKTLANDTIKSHIRELKVSQELNLLVSSSDLIHLWSLVDFTHVASLRPNEFSFSRSIEILPKNRLIVANSNDTLELWCLKTGKSLKLLKDHSPLSIKIISYIYC